MTIPIVSQATIIEYGSTTSPTTYTRIPQASNFQVLAGASAEIDVTSLDSVRKEYILGLADEGDATFELFFNYKLSAHAQLVADRIATPPTARNYRVTLNDAGGGTATKIVFTAYVKQMPVTGAVDNVNKSTVTLRITGPALVS